MKVALLADAWNRHTLRWARWMASQGIRVSLLSDRPARPDFDYQSINLYKPDWNFWRNLYAFKIHGGPLANSRFKHLAWSDQIKALQPDILHAHEAKTYGPMLRHFPKFARVLTPWGPDVESLESGNSDLAELIRGGMQAADVITTNGPGLEAHWSTLSGVSRDRFDLWSWGVDVRRFAIDSKTDSQPPCLAPIGDRLMVLSPRLPTAYYNLDAILRAWDLTLEANPSLQRTAVLVILRAGVAEEVWAPTRTRLSEHPHRATILAVEDYLDEAAMASVYRRAAVTIMLPRTDLLSMSLLESLACGSIPIVQNLIVHQAALSPLEGGSTERPAAAMVDSPDARTISHALLRVLQLPPEDRRRIGRRNRALIERDHDWDRCATRLLAVYERAMALKTSHPGPKPGV